MDRRATQTVAQTLLEDLQADVEAGSRKIDRICDTAIGIRDDLFHKQLKQASLMGALVKEIVDLKAGMKQQREIMRQLRQDIRMVRNATDEG